MSKSMLSERFGRLLVEGITSVATRREKTKAVIEQEIGENFGRTMHMVQRWQKGHVPAEAEQVAFLVRYCVKRGRVGRDWASSFLTQARYVDREALLNELFPTNENERTLVSRVYQNLPPRYGEFLGRVADIHRLLEGLASRWPVISIEGMGGMGKTTLAVEVTRRCLVGDSTALNNLFVAVVWVSAKDKLDQKKWLNETLDTIARVLDYPYITQLAADEKKREIDNLLRNQRTLVIIDNYETIEDPELEQWILHIPEPSKILMTTRYGQLRSAWSIHLNGLERVEAIQFIRNQLRRLGLGKLDRTNETAFYPLVDVTGGNPKAIEMALGFVKRGMVNLEEIVDQLHKASVSVNDIFDYLFANAWKLLEINARHALMAMTLFPSSANKEAIGAVVNLKGYYLDAALGQLHDLYLVDVNLESLRYNIHPLTRSFVNTQVLLNPRWKEDAEEHWLHWHLEFTLDRGGQDWDDWSASYGSVEAEWPNLLAVFDWCVINEKVNELRLFWQVDRLLDFSNIYGYWNDRVKYCNWLIEASERRGNLEIAVSLMSSMSWPLMLMGRDDQLDEAEKLLNKAYQLRDYAVYNDRSWLVNNLAILNIRRGNYDQAEEWLDQQISLLINDIADSKEGQRMYFAEKYYRAEIQYWKKDFPQAKTLYEEALIYAHTIGWQRAVIYTQNWLADIALKVDNLDEAEALLNAGYPTVVHNHDKRRIATYARSFALLEIARGNVTSAEKWVTVARDGFSKLGMMREIQELDKLVQNSFQL